MAATCFADVLRKTPQLDPAEIEEGPAGLKPFFDPDSGLGSVMAGNTSQLADGASATLVMSRKRADELVGIPDELIFRGFAVAGCEPDENQTTDHKKRVAAMGS